MSSAERLEAFRGRLLGSPDTESIWGERAQAAYGPSTLGVVETRIAGGLRPRTQDAVVKIVRLAGELRIPLYPLSIGNNWGYGSKTPAADGCVVVDLSRMDAVLELNAELGTVTVEPGVTTHQVAMLLLERNAPFVAPVVGAGPRSSMLGNVLDKGVSSAPLHDRASSLLSLTAVLPDGTLFSSEAQPATYRWGIGPYLDGLFLQSGMGIVIRATFLLAPKMTSHRALLAGADTAEQAHELIKALHRLSLSLRGVLASFQIEGPLRSYAHFTPRLDEHLTDQGVTSQAAIAARLKRLGLGRYNGLISLQGEPSVTIAAERIIRKNLARLGFVSRAYSAASIRRAQRFAPLLPRLFLESAERLRLMKTYLERSEGLSKPRDSRWFPLWRYSASMNAHQIEHGLSGTTIDREPRGGFLLFVAAITAKTPYAALTKDTEEVCASFGMEPMYGMLGLPDRYLHFAVQLTFDKQDAAQTKRAHACYEALFRLLLSHGGLPYRIPTSMRHLLREVRPDYWPLAKKIKQALDPDGIISPGRYEPPA